MRRREQSMTTEIQNALLIHNPNAGNGGKGRRALLDEARRIFAAGGIHTDLAETTKAGDATEIAQRANEEGASSSLPAAATAR